MKNETFLNFIEVFEKLSPFELDHFSKIFFTHFSEHDAVKSSEQKLSSIDLKDILINAMRAAHVEIAEKKVEDAKRGLDLTRSRVFISTTERRAEG